MVILLVIRANHQRVVAQTPAVAGSEITIYLGETFPVELQLLKTVSQPSDASAVYQGPPSPFKVLQPLTRAEAMAQAQAPRRDFDCTGKVTPDVRSVLLTCNSGNGNIVPGIYKSSGDVVLNSLSGETKLIHGIRFPIVTFVLPPPPPPPPTPKPPPPADFPEIVSAALVPTNVQTLRDGSLRVDDILSVIQKQFPGSLRNTRQNRRYLLQQIAQTKTLINATKNRYEARPQTDTSPRLTSPIFFQDFDRRLDAIVSQLAAIQRGNTSLGDKAVTSFLLAQMPKTNESATATTEPDSNIDKALESFVEVLVDAKAGFLAISQTGITSFRWSLETQPTGASVYISRLGEPETHWTGLSDLHDQTLEYARWKFRVDWNGCSKSELPDPYLQKQINIRSFKTGCKAQ